MDYVTDTHSLVWYFTDDSRLSKKALLAFEETTKAGVIIIPAVVLAEIMFIAKKGRTTLTFRQTLEKIEETKNFQVAPLDLDILRIMDTIKGDLEMHDQLIIATALWFDAPLITRDKRISKAKMVQTIW